MKMKEKQDEKEMRQTDVCSTAPIQPPTSNLSTSERTFVSGHDSENEI
jgi:hypothetical protein